MKIFVLGASHVGKTPFARRAGEALGLPRVAASAWVRARYPALPVTATADERAAQVAAMTAFATDALRADPDVSAASLRARIAEANDACVIEGVRNPYDFASTFDPRGDVVVFLERTGASPSTAFERGLDVIRAHVDWLVGAGLCDPARVFAYRFDTFGTIGDPAPGTLEHAIEAFLAAIPRVPKASPPPQRVHAPIPPLARHVRAEVLYGMDPARVGELRPCTAFAISSYLGSAPTFQIRLADGAVFSYIPPSALVDPARLGEPVLELADLVYHDCKSTLISVHDFEALHGPVLGYVKRRDLWLAGEYLWSVDWYAGNEMLHALALANGQLALLPSHKVKFGDHPPGFEPYRKIRREWTVSVG